MVDELHKISIPHFLDGGHAIGGLFDLGTVSFFFFMKKLFQVFRVYDLQGDLEEGLHEAMLHRIAEVESWILPLQAPKQKTLLCPDQTVIHFDLWWKKIKVPV